MRETDCIQPTNTVEICKIINDLKEKVGGVDGINAKTIKTIAPYIVTPLQHIFNLSIEHAIWPDSLKSAEVVPIHKAGAKSDISNFLKDCNILSDSQYSFIKGKGTADALNKITDIIYSHLDKSKPLIISFLDLAKAFDTVNHKKMLTIRKIWNKR